MSKKQKKLEKRPLITDYIKRYTRLSDIIREYPFDKKNVSIEAYITKPIYTVIRNQNVNASYKYENGLLFISDDRNLIVGIIPIEKEGIKELYLERVGGRYDLWSVLHNGCTYHIVVK